MKFQLQNVILTGFICCNLTLSFGQNYNYIRAEDIIKANIVSYLGEGRSSETANFTVYSYDTAVYSPGCLRTKITTNYYDPNTQKTEEVYRDSIIYEATKPKTIYRFYQKAKYSKMTFGYNLNGKIDTLFFQDYDKTGNLSEATVRSILYRNRFGLDSIYKRQIIYKGEWIDNGEFNEYIYDNFGKRIQYKQGNYLGDSVRVYQQSRIYNYFYTGNNLTLRVDSTMSIFNAQLVGTIFKFAYTYNDLGQQTTRIDSIWQSPSPANVFTPTSRSRMSTYNAKNQVLESFGDNWANGAWVEIWRSQNSYIGDTLRNSILGYSKNSSSTWWLSSKEAYKYCSIVNNLSEINTLDFKVSPNPAHSNISIDLSETSSTKKSMTIYNNVGHVIFQKNDVQFPFNLDISSFMKGLYFIKIRDEKSEFILKKIVITN